MSYQKHNWVTREVIRREHLQNIEDGIYNEQERGEEAENSLDLKISNEITRAQRKETELVSAINGLTSDLTDETNRATQRENTIETSLNEEIERAIAAENQLSELVSDNSDNIAAESQRSQTVEANLTTSITNEIARATQAESNLHDYVDEKVSTAYKASGSIYFEDLPALAKNRVGHVYNIKDDFTTTADFLEGEGKSYKAGTNVAIVQVEELAHTEVTPTGEENPSEEGWYELVNDTYVLSTDTEVDGNKTYYVRTDYALYYDVQAGFVDYSLFAEKTNVNDLWKVQGEFGVKNLLVYPYYEDSRTSNGVAYTVNNDGSITADGTASLYSAINLTSQSKKLYLPQGDYILSCDGAFNASKQYFAIWYKANSSTAGVKLASCDKNKSYEAFTITQEIVDSIVNGEAYLLIRLVIEEGTTINNTTFYPMIRYASDTDATWQPYAKTNRELTQQQYTFVGVCESAGNVQNKIVTVDSGFKLEKGVRIAVKFSNSNTATNVTLNVNGTGAKSIYYNKGIVVGSTTIVLGESNRYIYYIYDGTYWVWDNCGVENSYNSITVSELKTGTATSQRVVRADYLNQAITEMINEHGSSGHTIVDSNGTELTSRSKLKFINATVTDDETNDQTIVTPEGGGEIPQFTLAEWNALTDAEKAQYDGKEFVITDDYDGAPIDSGLSLESENPVQNKVVTKGINDVKDGVSDIVNVLGAKNLIPYPYKDGDSVTRNGITFTVNADKSITATGTATGTTIYNITRSTNEICESGKQYKINGCPSGGSNSTYRLETYETDASSQTSGLDFGANTDGTLFTSEGKQRNVRIVIYPAAGEVSLTFYPMIRPSGIEDATYVPYTKTNKELTAEVTQNSSDIQTLTNETSDIVNVYGSKNLFDNTMTTQVVSGVTYTVNSDKSISTSGTATEGASNLVGTFDFKAGVTYVLSGCPSGGSVSTYLLSIEGVGYDSGNGYEYTPSSDVTKNIMLTVFNGVTADNLVFKPMICTKSVYEADDTYVPYAMTNRELTKAVQTLSDSTEWTTTTPINNINVAYRKKNGIVFVRRNTSSATYTANTLVTIGNLPQGFRPSFTVQAVIQNDTAVVTVIVSADGSVKILSTTGNGIPAFCLSFPL